MANVPKDLDIFDENDGAIRGDILHLIIEHLIKEKLYSAANVLEDELSLKFTDLGGKRIKLMKFHKTILNGNWDQCIKLLTFLVPKNRQRSFLYQILRQQFLELIDNGEQERAYSFLMKHLKPLEDLALTQTVNGTEFKELCYLLTCKSVTEAEGSFFRQWKHFYHQRELLADRLLLTLHDILKEECCFYDLSQPTYATISEDSLVRAATEPKSSRLVSLLKQSYAYQIQQIETSCPSPYVANLAAIDPDAALEILSLDSLKEKEVVPITSLLVRSTPKSSGIGRPLVKRILSDYCPSVYPTSVYAVLSIQSPASLSASPQNSESPSAKMLSYLQQQLEPKITCLALTHSLKLLHPSSSLSDGVVVFGGLDTGEMIEWICYPQPSTSTSKDTQDSSVSTSASPPPFLQSVYALPGLSSEDLKIYSDLTVTKLCRSSPSTQPSASSTSTSISLGTKESYLKKHKKVLVNKKIRDIAISSSSVSSGAGALICLGASDGGINLLRAKERDLDNIFPNLSASSSISLSRECGWYEHLGRVNAHEGDAFSLAIDPLSTFVVSGGFDCSVSILDLATLTVIRRYKEHQASVTKVGCNRVGNLIYSASRDGSVKFWDILSGTCIKSLYPQSRTTRDRDNGDSNTLDTNHTEVTSATLSSDDRYLLTSSRFSPSRLIDLRTGNVVTKYTMRGYSGSTNWLYRSSFCANDQSVMGGTSPGVTAVWSTQSGELLYSLQIPSPSSASASTASASVSASSASSSYLKPSLPSIPPPSYPLTLPSEALFSSAQSHRSLVKQLRRAEVVQCASDRLSGLVATVTDSAVVLWK